MEAAGAPAYVSLHGLTKHFQVGAQTVRALDEVELTVAKGDFVVVMGPSGSGKSTLLNLVGGLDRPTKGSISVSGYDISGLDEIDLARYRRRMVGFVFQSFNLISTMTALANVEFPMVFAGVSAGDRHRRAKRLLDSVGLGHRTDHRPNELSGGEQQRVAIARSLANRPPLLLGDEPTGNLDTRTGREVMEILSQLNQVGHTLLVVSHDARLAEYADRVVHMEDGRMLRETGGRTPRTTDPATPSDDQRAAPPANDPTTQPADAQAAPADDAPAWPAADTSTQAGADPTTQPADPTTQPADSAAPQPPTDQTEATP